MALLTMAMPTMAMRTAHYLRLTLQVHIGNSLRQVTTSTGGSEAERWASVGGAVVAAIAIGNVARLMLQKAAKIAAIEKGTAAKAAQIDTDLYLYLQRQQAQQAQPANHNPSTRAPFAPSPGYTPPLDEDSDEDSDGDSLDLTAPLLTRQELIDRLARLVPSSGPALERLTPLDRAPPDADSDEDSDDEDSRMARAAEGINRAVDRAFPMHPPGTYVPPRDWRRAPTPDAVPMQVS